MNAVLQETEATTRSQALAMRMREIADVIEDEVIVLEHCSLSPMNCTLTIDKTDFDRLFRGRQITMESRLLPSHLDAFGERNGIKFRSNLYRAIKVPTKPAPQMCMCGET